MNSTCSAATKAVAGKYLTFRLGHEQYAIPVVKIREIVTLQNITALPETPASVRGVINLRGKVIPIIDLRIRLGTSALERSATNCIVVLDRAKGGLTGVVVDQVTEVATFTPGDIQAAPELGDAASREYLQGIGMAKEKVHLLIDIEPVLAGTDAAVKAALPAVEAHRVGEHCRD